MDNTEKRSERFNLRLTIHEKQKLQMLAATERLGISEYLRKRINEEYNQMLGYGMKGPSWQ